jgi:hypothetical protein
MRLTNYQIKKIIKQIIVGVISFPLFIISCDDKEQHGSIEKKQYGSLEGIVINEFGQPLENVVLDIEGIKENFKTNYNGAFFIASIPIGEHKISAFKEHYLTKIQNVLIHTDQTSQLDFVLTSGEPYLSIDTDSIINTNSIAGNATISIKANVEWLVKNHSQWIKTSVEKGLGDDNIILNWQTSSEDTIRETLISIISGNISKTIKIKQQHPIKILSYKGINGNLEQGIKDSVLIVFNQPISVNSVVNEYHMYVPEIRYTLHEGNSVLRVSYGGAARMGNEYPFFISVNGENNETLQEHIKIPFYDKRIAIEGVICSSMLSDDEKYIWLATQYPNKLYCISLTNFDILREYSFPDIHFSFIVQNPYNKNIYAISYNGFEYIHDNKIYIINPDNGDVVDKIIFEPETQDHPQYPMIYAFDIDFLSNGLGLVLLRNPSMTGMKMKLIESYNNNYLKNSTISRFLDISKVYSNHDRSKLLLMEDYGGCTLHIFDQTTEKYSSILPINPTRSIFLTPNKTNSKIYFGQLYDQFIMDTDGTMSLKSYLDNRSNGSADFSYRQGDNNIILFRDDDFFRVLDYNTQRTLTRHCILYNANGFVTTTNGEYAYFYHGYDSESNFYRFKMDDIFHHIH